MGVHIELDMQAIKQLEEGVVKAARGTMEQIETDVVNAQAMPFDTGDMQNNQTFVTAVVAGKEKEAKIITSSPQARRLYYHPEYNFQQGKNDNAGGEWLEPYLDGEKKDFAEKTFAELYKKETGVWP